MDKLKNHLTGLVPGEIADTADLERLLAASWGDFAGSGDGGMESYKLLGRMEDVHWEPPILLFVIERHGGTVCGSTRAELQHWEVNLDTMTVEITKVGRRQLEPMARRIDVEPIKNDLVQKILAGEEDPRLRWIEAGMVQVVLAWIFPDGSGYKQTVEGRRRRVGRILEAELECHGWCYEGRNVFRKLMGEGQRR
jgi:hypothetical protein